MSLSRDDIRVVVAIDFGATFSSYAYAHRCNPNEITVENKWGGSIGYKVPTVIKYQDDYSTVESWGFSALPAKKSKKGRNDQSDQSKSIELFKLFLFKDLTEKPSLPDGLDYRTVITDYLKQLGEMIKEKLDVHNWPNFDFYRNALVVLTSTKFDDEGIEIMRDCAFNAGLMQTKDSIHLTFVTELEAAAIHCLNSLEKIQNLKTGDSFIVVDCGGRTVNLTSHELLINNGISEITESTSGNCGSSLIDKKFLEFLRHKLGNSTVEILEKEYYNLLQYLVQEFCNNVKIPFNGKKSDFQRYEIDLDNYPLIKSIIDEGKEKRSLEESDWSIFVEFGDVKGMFDHCITKIIQLIREQLVQLVQLKNRKCSAIMLVGGFSESKYLQARIGEEFKNTVPNISVPMQPMIAVVKGGVQYGLQMETHLKRKYEKSIPDDTQIKHDEEIKLLVEKLFVSEQKYKELENKYEKLGERCEDLQNNFNNVLEEKQELKKTLVDQIILNQKLHDNNSKLINPLAETLEEKNNEICEMTKRIQEKDKEIRVKDEAIQAKGEEIQAKDEEIQAKGEEIQAKGEEIQTKDEEIQIKDKRIRAKDEVIQAKNEEIQAKNEEIQAKDEVIQAKDEEIRAKDEEIRAKDEVIQAKEKEIQAKDKGIQAKEKEIQAKYKEIQAKDKYTQVLGQKNAELYTKFLNINALLSKEPGVKVNELENQSEENGVKANELENQSEEIGVKANELENQNEETGVKANELENQNEETGVQIDSLEKKIKDLEQKNIELEAEASKYQHALGAAIDVQLPNNVIMLKKDISNLQDSLKDYTVCKGNNIELYIPGVQNLLKKYGSQTDITCNQNKTLIGAVLQRHVIQEIFNYAKEYFDNPKHYQDLYGIEAIMFAKAKQLVGIAEDFVERRTGGDAPTKVLPIILRQKICAALGSRGFNDVIDNEKSIPHTFISYLQYILNREIGKYRKFKDPKKKEEIEGMAGSIIKKIVTIFRFRFKVQEPVANYSWFSNNDKIDPSRMEGKWEDDEIDNIVVDICYFPLIFNKSNRQIYTRARIFQKSKQPPS